MDKPEPRQALSNKLPNDEGVPRKADDTTRQLLASQLTKAVRTDEVV
jgi:hypothetical protein